MAEMILLFLSVVALLSFPATEADYLFHICPSTTVFTPNSTFESNRNHLLSTLSSNSTRTTGFYNATAGLSPAETVYGLFLCRGDLTPADCKACVATATSEVVQKCPVEKEVVIWYDVCMLRYSNTSFFSVAAESTDLFNYMWDTGNISSEADRFKQVLGASMTEVATEAANDGDKFATREANFTGSISVYSLGQCTQDLSSSDCNLCLQRAITLLQSCCAEKLGARVLSPSCNVRFEEYSFYQNKPSAPAPAPEARPLSPLSPVRKGKSNISWKVIVVITVPITVSFVFFVIGCCLITKRAKKKYNTVPKLSGDQNDIFSAELESLQFDFGTIEAATNNFSDDNKLGHGGFGEVFRGLLLNGQEVAVKRLSRNSGQGAEEFKNEMVLVAKLQHRNLVRLLGFCLEGEEKMLVYEYVPNKSLDYILFDPEKQAQLDWQIRYKIIAGIARGIIYLHVDSRLRIIHRDLKASNILLDEEMHPKISDFGMARIFGVDQTQANTIRIAGTYGYMAPEYAMHGQFSVKSDLYSFGVLVLEIISGKKNSYYFQTDAAEDLASHAWKLWRDGTPIELLDPCLRDSYSRDEVIRCIHIGLLCVQEDPADRPTMESLVLMLNNYSVTLPLPQEPAFFQRTRSESDQPISKSSLSVYDGPITEVYAR